MDPRLNGSRSEGDALSSVDGVRSLSELAISPNIDTAVQAVREFLDIDVAYLTEMDAREQRFLELDGDGNSFGVGKGSVIPIEDTYCQKVLDDLLPNVISDIGAEPEALSLPISTAANVGAFVSVPLILSDGELFGTLCAASHNTRLDLGDREFQFLQVFARIIAGLLEREELDRIAGLLQTQTAAVETLVVAIEARDSYTGQHSRDVVGLAGRVARHLDLPDDVIHTVELVALLHDIGKIATPDAILQKTGPLTEEEWVVMREHPAEGERLIRRTPGLEYLAPMIRAEHERWDGRGYPDGLAGESIPIESRIALACDAYSAMVTDRPYRLSMSVDEAKAELAEHAGNQFDPEIVQALLVSLEDEDDSLRALGQE